MKKIQQITIKNKQAYMLLLMLLVFCTSSNAQAFIDATDDIITLPVNYLRFNGYEINNTVVLKWATAREVNNSHFNIQRSNNGIDFETINKVVGKDNSASINDYSYTDFQPLTGNLYYRLQQVDVDGKFSNSSTIIIKRSRDTKVEIQLYPNPINSTGNAFLLLKGIENGNYSYSLISISGQALYSNKFIHVGSMSTQQVQFPKNIHPGIYNLLILNNEGKKIDTKQIIVR